MTQDGKAAPPVGQRSPYPRGYARMDVEKILESRKAQYKTVEVTKEVELQYDLGNLLATDLNPLDASALRQDIFSHIQT